MRLATLSIGDPADGHEVTVIRAAGSLRGNVERWQRQLTPSAPADAVEEAVDRAISAAEEVDVAGKRGTVVLLDDASAAEGDAILAAIIPDDESSSLFVKFRGAAAVARREKDAFVRFVSSIRPD